MVGGEQPALALAAEFAGDLRSCRLTWKVNLETGSARFFSVFTWPQGKDQQVGPGHTHPLLSAQLLLGKME